MTSLCVLVMPICKRSIPWGLCALALGHTTRPQAPIDMLPVQTYIIEEGKGDDCMNLDNGLISYSNVTMKNGMIVVPHDIPVLTDSSISVVDFEYSRFLVNDELNAEISKIKQFNSRNAVAKMINFIDTTKNGHIGVLYGLRRTGKTVALFQIAEHYIKNGKKVAYATFNYRNHDFNAVLQAIHRLVSLGYELVLLDEISRCDGFLNCAMELSDKVGAKVVIAGTESLMIRWAMRDALFGRTCVAETTTMWFDEYRRIFPDRNIANFVKDGGVLWESEPESVEDYLMTSVIQNIKNSADFLESDQCVVDQRVFAGVDSETLYRLLVSICELNTEAAVLRNLKNRWNESIALKLSIAHSRAGGLKNDPSIVKIRDGLKEYYAWVPRDKFSEELVATLIQRLLGLNFLFKYVEMSYNTIQENITLTQPYIKREFIRRILSVVAQDNIDSIPETIEKLNSIGNGYILEDIVYMEASRRYLDKQALMPNIFRFRDEKEEIDLCIFRPDIKRLSLIEVKFSSEKIKTGIDSVIGQDKWLFDESIIGFLTNRYKPLEFKKIVMYRGQTDINPDPDSVRWVNVEDWLLGEVEI